MNQKNVNVVEEVKEPSFFEKNWKNLCIGAGAVVVVILGVFGYNKLIVEPREEAAADAIVVCQTQIGEGEYDKAVKSLTTFVQQYGSTKSGNLANAYLGIAYMNLGKYDDAIKSLEKFDGCGDAAIEAEAYDALGNAYACKKNYKKAVELIEKAAKTADNETMKAMFLIQAGELYELALNDKAKALELYNQVKNDCKQSMQSAEIEKYIQRASK